MTFFSVKDRIAYEKRRHVPVFKTSAWGEYGPDLKVEELCEYYRNLLVKWKKDNNRK